MTEIRKNDFIYDKNLKTQTFTYMYIKKKKKKLFLSCTQNIWVGRRVPVSVPLSLFLFLCL